MVISVLKDLLKLCGLSLNLEEHSTGYHARLDDPAAVPTPSFLTSAYIKTLV